MPEVVLVDFKIIRGQIRNLTAFLIQNHGVEPHLLDTDTDREVFSRLPGLLILITGRNRTLLAIRNYRQSEE